MSELQNSVNYNNLRFECVGLTKDVSFYEYMESKELFNAIKSSQIRFRFRFSKWETKWVFKETKQYKNW